jgi:polyisoprenoid-binding protein YceI
MRPDLKAVSLLCLSVASCSTLAAAAYSPPTRDPARLRAGQYVIEPSHTQILFSVLHLGFTHFYGVFSGASGALQFQPADIPHMQVDVSVPVASLATTSPKLDGELKGAGWLDAARYPTMRFQSTQVSQTGAGTADITGNLTLHGQTHPLVLHAVFNGGGRSLVSFRETLGFQLTGTLRRSEYGISQLVPAISDDVDLTIAAAFEKPPA